MSLANDLREEANKSHDHIDNIVRKFLTDEVIRHFFRPAAVQGKTNVLLSSKDIKEHLLPPLYRYSDKAYDDALAVLKEHGFNIVPMCGTDQLDIQW